MTLAETRAALSTQPQALKLATMRADGRPHVVPVAFALDGDVLVFITNRHSVKGRSLLRDGRAACCVDGSGPPPWYVSVEGTTEVSTDLDQLRAWASRIARRYGAPPSAAEAFAQRVATPDELLVRVHPTMTIAFTDIGA